jgi:hypothetical protein
MRQFFHIAAATLLLAVAACTPPADQGAKTAEGSGCPGGATALPVTGLCPSEAIKLLDGARVAAAAAPPEGCAWELNETAFVDQALLYQALSCKGKRTELEYRGGAHSAALGVKSSGFFESVPADFEPVKFVSLFEETDPKARILAFAREGITNKAESAACEVRPVGGNAPADAFVVQANAAYQAKQKRALGADMVDVSSSCGPFGFTNDGVQFWRISGGYAFFFNTGQDVADFNPDTLAVLQKGADGKWQVVP